MKIKLFLAQIKFDICVAILLVATGLFLAILWIFRFIDQDAVAEIVESIKDN